MDSRVFVYHAPQPNVNHAVRRHRYNARLTSPLKPNSDSSAASSRHDRSKSGVCRANRPGREIEASHDGCRQALGVEPRIAARPHSLPVKYVAPDGRADGDVRDIELDRDRVVLRRRLHGIPMKVGVKVSEFAGVTMRTLPPEGAEPAAVADHAGAPRQRPRAVPLFIATDGQDAMAEWKSWSRVLGLPLWSTTAAAAFASRSGGSAAWRWASRRRGGAAAAHGHAAPQVMRRKPGRRPVPTIHRGEREIIARNWETPLEIGGRQAAGCRN